MRSPKHCDRMEQDACPGIPAEQATHMTTWFLLLAGAERVDRERAARHSSQDRRGWRRDRALPTCCRWSCLPYWRDCDSHWRRYPERHSRLLLLASIAVASPALGRLALDTLGTPVPGVLGQIAIASLVVGHDLKMPGTPIRLTNGDWHFVLGSPTARPPEAATAVRRRSETRHLGYEHVVHSSLDRACGFPSPCRTSGWPHRCGNRTGRSARGPTRPI